jgi:desulfoferrodoxin (superoxide reductase-like protein)
MYGMLTGLQTRLLRLMTICFALLAATMVLTYPAVTQAHAPKDLALIYDNQNQTLQVKITHETAWAKHYVSKIVVKKNDKVIETYEYTSQPDPKEFTYTYKMEAVPGDVIEVIATCSIFGSKKATITLAK